MRRRCKHDRRHPHLASCASTTVEELHKMVSAWQRGVDESSVMKQECVADDDDTVNTECSDETDADAYELSTSRDGSHPSRRYVMSSSSTFAIRNTGSTTTTNYTRWPMLLIVRVVAAWLVLGNVCRLADSRDYSNMHHRPRRGNALWALHHHSGGWRARDFMRRAHSHNDYHQQDPLRSALQHGLKSIEVDVFPRQQQLWVGHTVFELNATRTISNMYIEPLLQLMMNMQSSSSRRATNTNHDNCQRPFPQSRHMQQRQRAAFTRSSSTTTTATPPDTQQHQQQHVMNQDTNALSLLVDFKGDAETSVKLLRQALAPLRPYLSKVDRNGRFQQGQITVLVSGNRPRDESLHEQPAGTRRPRRYSSRSGVVVGERYLFVDGRARDLHTNADTLLVPMVSIPWRQVHMARLVGRGEQYMSQLVRRAHAQGKLLRVWGAPNQEDLWRFMVLAKVDLLSIDDHGKFAQFASTAAFFR